MTDKHLLTVAEAAEYAAVHPDTIRRWIREAGLRRLQPEGPYGVVRIHPDDLDAFLARSSDERIAARVHRAITDPRTVAA